MRTAAILLSALVLIGTFALFGQMLMNNVSNEPSLDFTNAVGVWGMGPDPGANNIPWHTAGANTGQRVWDFSAAANHLQPGSTNGTDTNDPTKTAEGYSFTTDDYLVAANPTSLNFGTGGFSFGVLIKTATTGTYILERTLAVDPFTGPALSIISNKARFEVNGTTLASNTSITTNAWIYVAATRNGSSGTIYINGVLDNSGTVSSGSVDTTRNFQVGRWDTALYLTANIAMLSAHGAAFTAGQHATQYRVIYNSIGIPRGLNLPAPVAYYRWERMGEWASLLPFMGPLAFDPLGVRR